MINIEENAFAFSNISTIDIPDSVETIGTKAFYSCKKLKNVALSKKLKHIKSYAFEKCESITSIKIPVGTSYIGDCAFYQCKNLNSIQIPDSVSRLGYAFISKNTIVYCNIGSRANRYVEENYGFKKKAFDSYNEDFHV